MWYEPVNIGVFLSRIVGYILGLGDRHVQNILIDCQSAELIHIDLGKLDQRVGHKEWQTLIALPGLCRQHIRQYTLY